MVQLDGMGMDSVKEQTLFLTVDGKNDWSVVVTTRVEAIASRLEAIALKDTSENPCIASKCNRPLLPSALVAPGEDVEVA